MKKVFFYLFVLLVAGPPLAIAALRFAPPPVTSFMLQSETWPIRYQWVPARRIADSARKAVVASEDQKFWTHDGFDLEAMAQAYSSNKKGRRQRGASTISQQTAKNLFLWPGGGYARKGIEAYFTLWIELLWPKQRILETYLNIAAFGPGVYGVEAAARRYFGKSAAELSPGEAARLAAVLPNPKRWSVANPGAYVLARSNWILRQMGYRPAVVADEEPEEPAENAEDQAEAAQEVAAEQAEQAAEESAEAAEETQEFAEEGAPPPPPSDSQNALPQEAAPPAAPPAETFSEPVPPSEEEEGEEVPEAPAYPTPAAGPL